MLENQTRHQRIKPGIKFQNFSVGVFSPGFVLWCLVWFSNMKYWIFIFYLFCGELQYFFLLLFRSSFSKTIDIPIWIPIRSLLYHSRICLNQYIASTPILDNSIYILFPPPYATSNILSFPPLYLPSYPNLSTSSH